VTDPLRVLSYNIRYAGLDTGRADWSERREAVAGVLRHHRPDLVTLQECWLEQLPDLRERLSLSWVAHPDGNGEHTPIGYRPDRIEVLDEGAFGLAPDGERGVPAWDATYPRQVTHATVRDRATDRTFSLASVHLDHQGARAREKGAAMVLDRLPEGSAVVAGDCNCRPDEEPYRRLTAGLDDAHERATHVHGPAETYVGFGGDGTGETDTPERRRLDYVFVRGFEVTAQTTATDVGPDWHHPSDHLPVVVDLHAE
jgi:endonuclease/exonuclease/phosphatase family metal-dependent hydrolase